MKVKVNIYKIVSILTYLLMIPFIGNPLRFG